jgi:hypothetical protein
VVVLLLVGAVPLHRVVGLVIGDAMTEMSRLVAVVFSHVQ